MTNDSPAWNAYGPHHGIVVVDMQPDYLFQEKSLQIHVSKLISNVAGQVSACLQGGGKVIIVEFANRGETVKQIKERL